MIFDKVFVSATFLIFAFLTGGVQAQEAIERVSSDTMGFHKPGKPGTVTGVGFYNCPSNCTVYLRVMDPNDGCDLRLYTKPEGGETFFYIDKGTGVKTIKWVLVTKNFKFAEQGKQGIHFPPNSGLNIAYNESEITWTVGMGNFKDVPLILYKLNVASCSEWGPGIINRG